MAENVHSDIIINVDTSVGIAEIKNLQRQLASLNAQLMQSGANQAKAAQNIQRNLINNINATGQFAARVKTIASTTETFTTRLEKNKLGMGEYFRYAGASTKTFGRLFKNEFDTIEKVARERVKTLQTQYTKLGRDANGALKAISVRPLALDMENLATKTALAAQKQQLFNQLMKQGSTNLLNFGKNTQWAGRQLMVGFSIPLAYLGTAAAKTFMKMEEQALRFKRVYGDTFTASSETDKMIEQVKTLANEFTKYGVAAEKTMQMAANAAAMGKQGSDLLAQVNQATRLAVLGGVEQEQALETTISLTNAFGIAAENLSGKINFLNAVENQTVTSIEDLTIAVPKAGPVIQQLGGDVEDLAFFLTAMKEGGINASEGANALKSGLAALINPTAKASEMLGAMGVNIKGIVEANKGDVKATVVGFAQALDTLDPLNRARAIEQLFGKFQFARLSTLFQNVIAEGSQANRVLKLSNATAAELAVLSEREMKRIEDSPMYKFKKVVEDIKVSLVPLGEAFLKAITPIGEFVKGFLDKFNSMGDGAKQFAVIATTVVAGIGPILLMTFGLIANGAANMIKLFLGIRRIFQGVGQSSQTLGSQTEYMTMQQLEAASVAASLDQTHGRLIQTFTSETNAVNNLASAYARAVVAQSKLAGVPFNPVGAKGGKAPIKLNDGIVSVPGPKGAGDVIPAMLSPGESVIPAKMTQKYGGLISGMVNDNIPGFKAGLSPFGNITRRYFDGEDKVEPLSQAERDRLRSLKKPLRSAPTAISDAGRAIKYDAHERENELIRKAFGLPDSKIKNYLDRDLSHITKQREILDVDGKQYDVKRWALSNLQVDSGLVNRGLNYLSQKKINGVPFFETFDAKTLASKTGLSVKNVTKEIEALKKDNHPGSVNSYKVLAEMAKTSNARYAKPLAKLLEFRIKEYQKNVPGSYLRELEKGGLKFDVRNSKAVAALEEKGRESYRTKLRNIAKAGTDISIPKNPKPKPKSTTTSAKPSQRESYNLSQFFGSKGDAKTPNIKGGRLGAIARLFGKPMRFGGIAKMTSQAKLLSDAIRGKERSTFKSGFMSKVMPDGTKYGAVEGLKKLISGNRTSVYGSRYDYSQDSMKRFARSNPKIAVRTRSEDMIEALQKGDTKYKNMFDSGRSTIGDKDADRRIVEELVFGIPQNAPGSRRPVYGYGVKSGYAQMAKRTPMAKYNKLSERSKANNQIPWHVGNIENDQITKYYGDISLLLKNRVKKRSTFTLGDSLSKQSKIGGVSTMPAKFGTRSWDKISQSRTPSTLASRFLEAQVHGGFDFREIKRIVSSNPAAIEPLRQALAARGYKIPVGLPRLSFLNRLKVGLFGKKNYYTTNKDVLGFENGVVSVPGPKGAGDVVPAMLSPGESVIPTAMSKKYAPLISGMIDGNIPGYVKGKKGYSFGSDYKPYEGILAPPAPPVIEPAPIVKNESKLGKLIGETLGKSKKLTSAVTSGIGKVASKAVTSAAASASAAVLKRVGTPATGASTNLPGGQVFDNSTNKKYANQAAYDAAQKEAKNARTPGTSYATKTGKVYKFDEKGNANYSGKKVARTATPINGSKFATGAGAVGGIATMAGMGMMMSGDQSGMGNNLMMGGMALSMLPMLANKTGLVVAGLAAIVGAFMLFKIKSEEATKAGLGLARSMTMTNKKLEDFAAINGTVTASQEARKNAELQLTGESAKKRYYGQNLLESDFGKGLLSEAETMSKEGKSSKEVAANFAQQLSYAVVQGTVTQEQAMSIAAALGEKLQDYSITANIDGQLVNLFGRNGENLLRDPLSVTLEIQKKSTEQQLSAYENALKIATENGANDGLSTTLGIVSAGSFATAGYLAAGALATGGTSLIPAAGAALVGIGTGAVSFGQSLGDEEENNKYRAVAVQLGAEQVAQNQGLVDSLTKQYDIQIAELKEKKKAAKTDKERAALEDQINNKVKARNTAIEDQKTANKKVFDDLVKQAGVMGGSFDTAIGASIDERFKDSTGAVKTAADLAKQKLSGLSNTTADGKQNTFKTTLQIGLASGEFDPITVSNIVAMSAKDGKIEKSFNLLVGSKGTSEANQIIQLLAKSGTAPENYDVVLNYLNNSKTFKSDQEALAQIANMQQEYGITVEVTVKNIEDVREFTDETSLLNNGKPITRDVLTNFRDNTKDLSPETKASIDQMINNWDVLSGGDNKLKYSVLVDYKIGEANPAAIWAAYVANNPGYANVSDSVKQSMMGAANAEFFADGADGKGPNSGDGDGTGNTGGATKKDPINDILNRLKMVRDAAINATGGIKELIRVVGKTGNKDIATFTGVEQNLIKSGVSQDFMDFYDSLDAKAKLTYVSISGSGSKAVAKLKADAMAVQSALRESAIGDYQSSLARQTQDAKNSAKAFQMLKDAGMSSADALELSKDAKLADAIAAEKDTKDVLKLVDATNKLADAQSSATKFQKTFDDARDAWDAKKNKLDIDFRISTKTFQKAVTDAENEIAKKVNESGGLDDLQAGLTQIGWAEDEINKKYDLRVEALDKIASVNEKIAAAQRGQLNIADALSRGDISAAAAAVQDERSRAAQDAIATQRELLDDARKAELDGVSVDVNGKKLTRKDIEAQILVIEKAILKIEEDRLEPARESIRLEEVKRLAALTSLEEQELEWQKLENDIALAATAAWDYVAALKEAQALAADAAKKAGTNGITGPENTWKEAGIDVAKAQKDYVNSQKAFTSSGLSVSAYMRAMDSGKDFGFRSAFSSGGMVKYFADGGTPLGTDIVPAMLTPGEFVMSKYSVDSFGVDKLKAINNGTYSGESVYNYELNVNVKSDANADEIARSVMTQIKQIDSQRLRGNRL